MKKQGVHGVVMALAVMVLMAAAPSQGALPDNAAALRGAHAAKSLFDINLDQADKLTLYLQVIGMTHDGIREQGLEPDFVVAFRGTSVRLLDKSRQKNGEQRELLKKIARQIKELSGRGVRFEACSVATDLFKVDNGNILPEVKVVGNTFISLIGYQSQGYAVIPIQ